MRRRREKIENSGEKRQSRLEAGPPHSLRQQPGGSRMEQKQRRKVKAGRIAAKRGNQKPVKDTQPLHPEDLINPVFGGRGGEAGDSLPPGRMAEMLDEEPIIDEIIGMAQENKDKERKGKDENPAIHPNLRSSRSAESICSQRRGLCHSSGKTAGWARRPSFTSAAPAIATRRGPAFARTRTTASKSSTPRLARDVRMWLVGLKRGSEPSCVTEIKYRSAIKGP